MLYAILGTTLESLRELAPVLTVAARFLVAVLIILGGYILGRGAGRFIQKGIAGWKLNGLIEEHRIDQIVGSFTKYLIYIVAIVLALNQIGLALNILNSIVIILLAVVAVGIFLSIKDFVPNIVAGIYVAYKKRVKVGDRIKVQDVEGVVKEIELVETKIETRSGHEVVIPNSYFVKNVVFTKPNPKRKPKKKK